MPWWTTLSLKLALTVLGALIPGLKPIIETIIGFLLNGALSEEIHEHVKKFSSK